ncbi:MAG: hemerythrin domain-containing protein [Candidatus Limnocylindrales bacterium]
MQTLSHVSHEHQQRLWSYVEQLNAFADCLDFDCLDPCRLAERLPELRELHDGLTTQLIPHMEAVEAVVYPTLERLLGESGKTAPMAREHDEVRRLVAAIGEFAEHPEEHTDRIAILVLRRRVLRLHALLKTHLAEEELYLPIMEGRLTPGQEAALARALDHLAASRL